MWASGIIDIIDSCVSPEALERLQDRQRPMLKAISREKPELYAQIGTAFTKRTARLDGEKCATQGEAGKGEPCATPESPNVRAKEPSETRRQGRGRPAKCKPRESGEGCAKTASKQSVRYSTQTSPRQEADAEAAETA
jgi:hypothetical protein